MKKQTTFKAGLNQNSVKNFTNIKTTFKNIFLNIVHIDFTIYCLKINIQIDVNKQTNNMYINKQTRAKAGFNPNSIKNFINVKTIFKNIFNNLIQNITNLKICMT